MLFELLSKEELVTAAIATKRPVAFLVGSPLSLRNGVGVPGVTEILELVRAEIRDRASFALSRFEVELRGKAGGEAYREAMKWLGRNAGQDAINDVIKAAVLKARRATASELSGGDGEPEDWNIPTGTIDLAELVARENERFRGPVLTTNFDPLFSLAVRKTGGRTGRRVLTADGTLAGPAEDDICAVVHLHGFWRNSDTLNTQAQLTSPRPRLMKSLQRLLQGRTLIVAAYGGWDDVFTRALVDLMNDEQAPLDVIWCFHENDAEAAKERHKRLFTAVEPAIVMNRFRAFGGIDCHGIFGEILATLRSTTPAAVAPSIASPLAGWELIDAAYLGSLEPLRSEEVIRYFDGATPTWRHAVCADIPSRIDAEVIASRIAEIKHTRGDCSLQLIRAAGGEGKTTLLLQAAATAAKIGSWSVLWRRAPHQHLSAERISVMDPARDWLIVADDAENLVDDLGEAARLLHENGRSHVHFLLAARDTDWRHVQGDRQPWSTWLKRYPDILLRKLTDNDAAALVGAWQKYGSDGLRELARLSDAEKRIAALLDAVRGPAANDEGSFFGGLLAVRFGPDGLRSHVVSMLNRLKGQQVRNSERTLFDALCYVAACHAVGIPGLAEKVLADLIKVPRDWLQTLVVNPLGEEAAAVRSAGHVLTRHRKVADAILVAAERDLGTDIAEIWRALVRETVRAGRDRDAGQTHAKIIHAGPRLQSALPKQFSEQRRKEIAVAAASASIAAEPERLSRIVDLGKTFRNAHDYTAAAQLFRENLSNLSAKIDFRSVVRGYWYEWSIVEGLAGNDGAHAAAGAWIAGLSLSDHLKRAPITSEDVKIGCAGLGVAFGRLAAPRSDCPFARGRRAAAYLGRLTNPDPRTLNYFETYDSKANAIGTPQPGGREEALAWLTTAILQSGRELIDPFLKELLKLEQLSFKGLRGFFNAELDSERASQHAPPPAMLAESRGLVELRSDIDNRIKAGIQRVLAKAWKSVPGDIVEEDRLKIARRNAKDEISRLSPSIKRQVGAYFETRKWEPLKAHSQSE